MCFFVFAVALPAAAQIRYDNYIYEDEAFLDRLDDMRISKSSPFEDVAPDHWAYRAVQRLVESGLLQGYDDTVFRGDQVVTRYELAMIVAKMLDNYLEWYRTGRITQREYPTSEYYGPRGATSLGPPLHAIEPPEAIIAPSRRVTVELPSLGSMGLTRTVPRFMGEEDDGAGYQLKLPPEIIAEIQDVVKTTMADELALTNQQIDELEKLVNEFKKELKDIKKEFKKALKENNRISIKNQNDISKLEEENKRFNITGSERFFWYMEGPITGDYCYEDYTNDDRDRYDRCNMRTTDLYNTLQLDFTSRPDTDADLTVAGSLIASTRMGGRRSYNGDRTTEAGFDSSGTNQYEYWKQQNSASYRSYIEGTSTALSLRNLYIDYEDPTQDRKNPRNFKLRSLKAGDISVMFSPMTIMGKPIQGIAATVQLNDYSITAFGAREKLHQTEPSFLPDVEDDYSGWHDADDWAYNTAYFDQDQYDRYKYGFTFETNVLGNPMSKLNLSRVMTYDDKDTNFPGCSVGNWVDLTVAYDQYSYKDPNTDFGDTDFFCLPPEKNSVSSMFLIYPLLDNVNMFAEYAHSTYYKEGYKLLKPDSTFDDCDITDPDNENSCWWESKEELDQDDAILVLLNYNKGPITIFPVGYMRLGPEFVTDFDISGFMGGDGDFDITSAMSIIPIKIKSMEGLFGSLKYEMSNKDTMSTLYAKIQEISPMYLDLGALSVAFQSNSDGTKSAMSALYNALSRINNRTGKIDLDVWTTDFKHYISDKVSFNANYTKVNAGIPSHCVDANFVSVTDEYGNTMDKIVGNGFTNCTLESGKDQTLALALQMNTQKYEVNWETSRNASLTSGYKISDVNFRLKFGDATSSELNTAESIIDDLVPKGKSYSFYNEFKYRLTKSTRFKMYYIKEFDKYPDGLDRKAEYSEQGDFLGYTQEKYPVIDNTKFLFVLESNF